MINNLISVILLLFSMQFLCRKVRKIYFLLKNSSVARPHVTNDIYLVTKATGCH